MRVGDPILGSREFDSRTFFAEFRYDSVNDVNFPREGGTFALGWQAEREGKGTLTDANADLLVYDQLYAHSWGRNTGILWGSAGLRTDNDVDVVRSFFSLGGFLNMSGITPETLVGPNYAILRGYLLPPDRRRWNRLPGRAGVHRRVARAGQRLESTPGHILRQLQDQWQRVSRDGHHSRPGLLRDWA